MSGRGFLHDKHLNWQTEYSRLSSPLLVGLMQSIENLNRTKQQSKRELLLPYAWLGHQGFSCLQTETCTIHSPGSPACLPTTDGGTHQSPQSYGPILSLSMYACIYKHISHIHLYTHIYVLIYVHTRMCTHIHMSIHVYRYTYTCIHTHVYIHV